MTKVHLKLSCSGVAILLVALGALWIRSAWTCDLAYYATPGRSIMLMAGSQAGVVGLGYIQAYKSPGFHFVSVTTDRRFRWWFFDVQRGGGWVLRAPHWFVALLLSLPITVLLMRRARQSDDTAANRCRNCGYDLRATPDRCPECGAVPAASRGKDSHVHRV